MVFDFFIKRTTTTTFLLAVGILLGRLPDPCPSLLIIIKLDAQATCGFRIIIIITVSKREELSESENGFPLLK